MAHLPGFKADVAYNGRRGWTHIHHIFIGYNLLGSYAGITRPIPIVSGHPQSATLTAWTSPFILRILHGMRNMNQIIGMVKPDPAAHAGAAPRRSPRAP